MTPITAFNTCPPPAPIAVNVPVLVGIVSSNGFCNNFFNLTFILLKIVYKKKITVISGSVPSSTTCLVLVPGNLTFVKAAGAGALTDPGLVAGAVSCHVFQSHDNPSIIGRGCLVVL